MRVKICVLSMVLCWLLSSPTVAVEYAWTLVKNPAAFAPRDGAGALSFNGQMWLLGGWNPGVFGTRSTNEVWTSVDGANWSFVNYAPWEPRHTAGYAVLGDKMWIVGGDPLQGHYTPPLYQGHYQPDVWNTSDGVNWQQVTTSAPWGQRCLHYTVVHDGKIWVMGGQTMPNYAPAAEALYNDVWNSSDGVNWTQVTEHAAWAPRGMIGGAVEFNGRMWVLGGGTYDTPAHPVRNYYNDVWSSADGVNWQQDVANAPWDTRQYHDVAVFDNKMWVLEGYNANLGGNRNDVWYSSDGVHWNELADTPWAPRHAASVFVYDNALWMVAGNNMQSDVWRLDPVPEPAALILLTIGIACLIGWHGVRRRCHAEPSFIQPRSLAARVTLGARTTLVLLMVLGLAGCGGKPSPKTYPVAGKLVVSRGAIPVGGTVQFETDNPELTTSGRIEADGQFTLTTQFAGRKLVGATEGPHRVTVFTPIRPDHSGGQPTVLKDRYTIEPKENHITVKLDN